ncbi:hypothetical protein IFR04_008269 [Cadophora malorum]|uniref:Uncharacterized protein n=1 Tax=Cadophora malorum TaxID=108018 RepID=A0A8H7WA08_9HELO|nr:hypothetical protein IFR04_008269 [Cadophora malorum]
MAISDRSQIFLWVLLLGSLAGTSNADGGSDFSHKLFSDLAPVLALFGEKFTQQFLSEAYSWLDCVIFSFAPLGIITAIVGAIRVAGYPWMRSVIRRARENRAAAELEFLSSTSHEVCELWNGNSIVRTMERPLVAQIVAVEKEMGNAETLGLYILDDVGGIMEMTGCFDLPLHHLY